MWWLGEDEEYSYRYNNRLTKIFFRSTNMRPRNAMVQLYRSTTGSLHSGIKGWLLAHVRWLVATAVVQDITTSREAVLIVWWLGADEEYSSRALLIRDVMSASSCVSMALYCPSLNKALRGTTIYQDVLPIDQHEAA